MNDVGSPIEVATKAAEPKPPHARVVQLRRLVSVQSFAQTGLLILAALYTSYFLRDVLVPIAVAFVFYLVLAPLLRGLERLRIPTSLAAALLVLGLTCSIGGVVYLLLMPASQWVGRLPNVMSEATAKIAVLKKPVEKVAEASQQVDKITAVATPVGAPQEVVVRDGGFLEKLYGNVTEIGVQLLLIIVLLYFLLATGAIFREKLIKAMPTFGDKRRAFTITFEIQRQISRYLLTVALINLGLGVSVGLALWSVHMPSPILWGAMATVVNFIPYVGSALGIGVVAIVALISFDTVTQAVIPPLLYLSLASIEGQFVSPMILGRSLTLNPLVIFIAVILWGWMWGVPGALLAVPLLVVLKVICDNVASLARFGEFMSGKP